MILSDELKQIKTVFLDTAPIIYYIEANPQFGNPAREIVNAFRTGKIEAFSSVITLAEVLSKPIEIGDEKLAGKFAEFLKYGKNFHLIEVSISIAERAGRLRGQYSSLRTVDAIQISSAIDSRADVFITNDKKLQRIKEIKVLVLKDYS